MDIFGVLTLFGGLALFLYGMKIMGDGLVTASGGKLEKILERLTNKRITGLLLGMIVTAIIQSSSATTVMVVGFVNSGIMTLSRSVGIIMGANIGTTVTSWLLSLTGIQGSNIFLKLLKPSSFSPVLAVIGVILIMASKEGSKKYNVGTIMLGFAILMFGMETMSDSVSPLADDPNFTSILTAFSNPILGLIAGAVLTAIIQSSSASVGILQALCLTGAVNFSTAIPIIMGQNIGTCVTALISSIGASKNARRASFVHLYFNLIGTILFMIVFYSLNSFMHFAFLDTAASAAGIAVIHSLFNIGCAIVLFPFANVLVKLATLTVPDKKGEETSTSETRPASLVALDERFLDQPAFAMQLCKRAANEMASLAERSFDLAMSVYQEYSESKSKTVIALEQEVDQYEDLLGTYLVKLSGRNLNIEDSRMLSVLLQSIGEFERISDYAIAVVESAEKMQKAGLKLTDQGLAELEAYGKSVSDILNMTSDAFIRDDKNQARNVEPMEEVVDSLGMEMKKRHVERLRAGVCSMEAGLILSDIINSYNRVAAHCSNVAVGLIEIQSGELDKHGYFTLTDKESAPWFRDEMIRLSETYKLPENKA
jgi:phosphate:Na+ symporter